MSLRKRECPSILTRVLQIFGRIVQVNPAALNTKCCFLVNWVCYGARPISNQIKKRKVGKLYV